MSRFDQDADLLVEFLVMRLVLRRNKLNISQAQLAEEAGVSQSYIAKVESGETIPSLRMLAKVLVILGTTIHLEFADPPIQAENRKPGPRFSTNRAPWR